MSEGRCFAFFENYYEMLISVPAETAGEVVQAMGRFFFEGIDEPELEGVSKAVFLGLKHSLNTSREKSRAALGNKGGGAPVGNQNAKKDKEEKQTQNEHKTNSEQTPIKLKIKDKDKDINLSNNKNINIGEFESLWSVYPQKANKEAGRLKYLERLEKYSHEDLLRAANNYAAEVKAKGTEQKYIKHLKTFFASDDADFVRYMASDSKLESPSRKSENDDPARVELLADIDDFFPGERR